MSKHLEVVRCKEILMNILKLSNLYGELLEDYLVKNAKYLDIGGLQTVVQATKDLQDDEILSDYDVNIIIMYYIHCEWIDDFNSIYIYCTDKFNNWLNVSKSQYILHSLNLDKIDIGVKEYSTIVISRIGNKWRLDTCKNKTYYEDLCKKCC